METWLSRGSDTIICFKLNISSQRALVSHYKTFIKFVRAEDLKISNDCLEKPPYTVRVRTIYLCNVY